MANVKRSPDHGAFDCVCFLTVGGVVGTGKKTTQKKREWHDLLFRHIWSLVTEGITTSTRDDRGFKTNDTVVWSFRSGQREVLSLAIIIVVIGHAATGWWRSYETGLMDWASLGSLKHQRWQVDFNVILVNIVAVQIWLSNYIRLSELSLNHSFNLQSLQVDGFYQNWTEVKWEPY